MSGTAEAAGYSAQLEWLLRQFHESLGRVPAGRLGWAPQEGTNSAMVIARHAMAVVRVYALGFGAGFEVERNRAVEFLNEDIGEGDHAFALSDLHYQLLDLVEELRRGIEGLGEEALSRRIVPEQHLWGTGQPKAISGREAIVEAIRHTAIHLGELRLTLDLCAVRGGEG